MYLHASCFVHVHSTFIKAINNNRFTKWSGLTSKLVTKQLSTSITTTKGKINQELQRMQSPKYPSPMIQTNEKYDGDDFFPLSETPNVK